MSSLVSSTNSIAANMMSDSADSDFALNIEDEYAGVPDRSLLFSYILHPGADNKTARAKFLNEYGPVASFVFVQECFVLYNYIKAIGRDVDSFSERSLKYFLSNQREYFSKHSQIQLGEYEAEGTDSYITFSESVLDFYRNSLKLEVSQDAYNLAYLSYKEQVKSEFMTRVYEVCGAIIRHGVKVGKRFYKGPADAEAYHSTLKTAYDNFTNQTHYRGAVAYGLTAYEEENMYAKRICSIGAIKELDKLHIYLKEKQILNLVSGSKMGKSRFLINLVCTAILEGKNVAIWSPENGFVTTELMFRARYFYEMHFKGKKQFIGKFSDETLGTLDERLPKDLRDLEHTVWTTFKQESSQCFLDRRSGVENITGRDLGILVNVEDAFTVDNYLTVIDRYTKEYDIDLWVVDYFGLIGDGDHRQQSTSEKVAGVYKEMKNYMNGHHFALAVPAQMKQEKVELLKNMKDSEVENANFETLAGLSFEIFKTSDINMFLWSSDAEKSRHEARLFSMPSRVPLDFKYVTLTTNLGVSYFQSKENGLVR